MKANGFSARGVAGAGGRFLGHAAAMIVGLALIVAGIGMGVSVVLLPIGVPVSLAGLGVFLWGAVGKARGGEPGAGAGAGS